jgi:hypothetical protein
MPNRVRFQLLGEAQLAEEADQLLEGLGPRFTDWWGYEPLPVDADLLPAIVPGYKKPFRLHPPSSLWYEAYISKWRNDHFKKTWSTLVMPILR